MIDLTPLRPRSNTPADITAALVRCDTAARAAAAETAVVDQRAIITTAKATRDNGRLDSDAATLRKAEAALTEARE